MPEYEMPNSNTLSQGKNMATLFVLALIVLIGGAGFYVASRPTVTPSEQDRIVREEVLAACTPKRKGP